MNRRQRRRRVRLIRAALIGPPLVLVCCGAIGLAISPVHREETSRIYASSPETVWRALTDLDGMPAWRQDLVALERLPRSDGLVRWRELGLTGRPVAYQWTEAIPNARLVVQTVPSTTSRLRWEYRIRSLEAGTELSVIEERAIRNPIVRTFVKVFGSDRDRIEALARDLAVRLSGHRQRIAAAHD